MGPRKPAAAALVAVSALAIVALIIAQTINNGTIRHEMQLADQSATVATKAMHDAMDARGLAVRRLYGAQVLLAHATLEQTQIGQAERAGKHAAGIARLGVGLSARHKRHESVHA